MPLGEGEADFDSRVGRCLDEGLQPAEVDRPVKCRPLEGDVVFPAVDSEPKGVGEIVGPRARKLIIGGDPGVRPPLPLIAEEVDDHVRCIDLGKLLGVVIVELPEAGTEET